MSWPIQRFATLVADTKNALVGGPFGSKLTTRDYVDEGVPVIRGANMSNGRFILEDDFVFVTEEKKRKDLQNNLARPGDLIFTQRGTLGQVAIIPDDASFSEFIVSQSQMKATLDPEKADTAFYYYFFSSQKVVDTILNMTSSSGVPHINLGTLKDFEVPVPDLPTQQRIAGILSAYDDLIENNRRRIGLLEQAARLLYREWFVHLRFPGHETAKIIDGLPEGWEKTTLGKHCPLIYGKALKAETRVDGPFDVYGSSGIVGTHNKALTTGPAIIVGRKGNVGSVYWARRGFWPIDTVYFIDPANSDFFTYFALQNIAFQNTDVAVPGLNRDYAHTREIKLPPKELVQSFNDRATVFLRQAELLSSQNDALTRACDLLLPRLMDGRIPV